MNEKDYELLYDNAWAFFQKTKWKYNLELVFSDKKRYLFDIEHFTIRKEDGSYTAPNLSEFKAKIKRLEPASFGLCCIANYDVQKNGFTIKLYDTEEEWIEWVNEVC